MRWRGASAIHGNPVHQPMEAWKDVVKFVREPTTRYGGRRKLAHDLVGWRGHPGSPCSMAM